jgi:hypothetical protein
MADCSNNVTLNCVGAGAGGLSGAASQVANATQVGAAAGAGNVAGLAGLAGIDPPGDPDAGASVGAAPLGVDPLDAGL